MIDARVQSAGSIADFIGFIERETSSFTTLIICSTREYFVEQVTASIEASCREQRNSNQVSEYDASETEAQATRQNTTSAAFLLSNTIGAIANSRRIKLVFCPSVPHLRAYIATLQPRPLQDNTSNPKAPNAGYNKALIAIVDIVALHHTSTQFSVQGLSQTLALAVETAARIDSAIMLCECEDAVNLGNSNHGHGLWDLQIPPLNSSSSTTRSGHVPTIPDRHISVRQVAQRWFRFEE